MIVPTIDIEMIDAKENPPPRHDKSICGNSELGVTTIGLFMHGFHDCRLPMPKFPQSLKKKE